MDYILKLSTGKIFEIMQSQILMYSLGVGYTYKPESLNFLDAGLAKSSSQLNLGFKNIDLQTFRGTVIEKE